MNQPLGCFFFRATQHDLICFFGLTNLNTLQRLSSAGAYDKMQILNPLHPSLSVVVQGHSRQLDRDRDCSIRLFLGKSDEILHISLKPMEFTSAAPWDAERNRDQIIYKVPKMLER